MKRFRDNWNAEAPAGLQLAAIQMPNTKFDRPDQSPWARLTVIFGTRSNAAVGGTKVRQLGELYLQVFLPEDSGTKVATDSYDAMATIYDNKNVPFTDDTGFILTQAVTSRPTGIRDGYEQTTISAPFYSDDNR